MATTCVTSDCTVMRSSHGHGQRLNGPRSNVWSQATWTCIFRDRNDMVSLLSQWNVRSWIFRPAWYRTPVDFAVSVRIVMYRPTPQSCAVTIGSGMCGRSSIRGPGSQGMRSLGLHCDYMYDRNHYRVCSLFTHFLAASHARCRIVQSYVIQGRTGFDP